MLHGLTARCCCCSFITVADRYTGLSVHTHTRTHTHTFNGPFSGTTRVSRYQKGKPIWILLMQEAVSGSGISWAIHKSAPRSRQITMPAPHHSVLQAGCPSCRPTNSLKALKACTRQFHWSKLSLPACRCQ